MASVPTVTRWDIGVLSAAPKQRTEVTVGKKRIIILNLQVQVLVQAQVLIQVIVDTLAGGFLQSQVLHTLAGVILS